MTFSVSFQSGRRPLPLVACKLNPSNSSVRTSAVFISEGTVTVSRSPPLTWMWTVMSLICFNLDYGFGVPAVCARGFRVMSFLPVLVESLL